MTCYRDNVAYAVMYLRQQQSFSDIKEKLLKQSA
nr:MAG TPA: hypothetical protein [Caudoviricetes sp.]